MYNLVAWTLLAAVVGFYLLHRGGWPATLVSIGQRAAPTWTTAIRRTPRAADGISLSVTTGNLDTRDGSNVQIGIFGLLGSDTEHRRMIQRWIAPWLFEVKGSPSQAKIWEQRREASVQNSGAWFTGDKLQDWLDNGSNSLWLYGEMGCGKSMLSSLITSKLYSQATAGGFLLAFTFFAWDLPSTHSKHFIARTLLASLSSMDPLPKEIKKAYEKVAAFETVDALILIQQIFAHKAANQSPKKCTTLLLVMDAIDELPSMSAEKPPVSVRASCLKMLDTLCSLAQSSESYRLRVILTSRYDEDIGAVCKPDSGWTREQIPENKVKEDMRLVLQTRISTSISMHGLMDLERSTLAQKIIQKSGFSFRLSSMYMDALMESRLTVLQRERANLILDELPSNLFEYYDRILAQIQRPEEREDVLSALRLLLFGAEPLTVGQVVASCATIRLHGRDGPLFSPGLELKAWELVRLLNGLIEPAYTDAIKVQLMSQSNISIRMKHFSVVEWLRRPSSNEMRLNCFRGSEAQRHIALQCFAYLVYCHEKMTPVTSNAVQYELESEQFPFARYAANNWFLHAAAHLQMDEATASPMRHATNADSLEDTDAALVIDPGLTRPTAFALRVCNAVIAPGLCSIDESIRIRSRLEHLVEPLLDARRRRTLFGHILQRGLRRESESARRLRSHQEDHAIFAVSRKPHFSTPLYHPIGSYPKATRFLVRHPVGAEDDDRPTVSGRLVTESLDNGPSYIALTYTWAYDRRSHKVRVNDQPLSTSEHLSQWLFHWQSDERLNLPVWIDAISIDMTELGERTHQIQLMGRIYSQAVKVVVWLGQGTENEWAEINAANIYSATLRPLPEPALLSTQRTNPDRLEPHFQSIITIFNAYLFRRLWIYQEIALARTVILQCGPALISLDDIARVISDFKARLRHSSNRQAARTRELSPASFTSVLETFDTLQRLRDREDRPKLPELLYLLRHRYCRDPRDKLFSLIHFLVDEERQACAELVDLTRSAAFIFNKLNFILAQTYGPLSLFSMHNRGWHSMEEDRPLSVSGDKCDPWPPLWAHEMYDYPLAPGAFLPESSSLYHAGMPQYHSSESSPFPALDAVVHEVGIRCSAIFVDTINRSAPVRRRGNIGRSFGRTALLRTMLEDRIPNDAGDVSMRTFRRLSADPARDFEFDDLSHQWRQLEHDRGNRLDRQLFVTREHVLGNGPRQLRRGDKVIVFPGAHVPHIVRWLPPRISMTLDTYDTGANMYKMIGECYLDCKMDGEIMDDLEEGKYTVRPITITWDRNHMDGEA